MFSSGLSIEYRISKSFSVKSGIHYTLRGEKTKDLGYGSDYNGFGTYIEKMIFKNRYHYIGVPIIGSIYLMNKVKIQLYSSIGVGFDFLYLRASRSTIKIHNEEEENNFQKEKPNDDGFNDYNIFNPSGLLSFGLDLKIGNKSKLVPQIYVSFGKKYYLNNNFIIVPAFNIHSSLTNIPSVELNLMAYYYKRVGVGVSIRNKDFISGIFQVRISKNLTAGFSYDYSINKLNAVAPRTIEFMLGLTPLIYLLGNEKEKHNIARCPSFDF